MSETVLMPRELRAAELRPGSYDKNAHTIEVVWTTGAAVRRYSYDVGSYDEVLELGAGNVRLGRLNAGAPLLNTHNSGDLKQVIGSVVPGSAAIRAGRGLATVLLSRAGGDADIVQKISDGVIRNISAGYIRHVIEKTEGDAKTIPVWRVVDWEPCEISAVPIPADPGAQTRSSAQTFPCLVRSASHAALPLTAAEAARARMILRSGHPGAGAAAQARRRMVARGLAAGFTFPAPR
jgi:hypothetical protein